ncbi:MAG: branched-chain-amino-acid transaminase [Candidatus Brocadiaceae bacterium]|nr:branched-chain-amino-acid transaminase [Candidatus Brocadiaceae bacterium]
MGRKIYIDGEFYEKDKARISVFDHGLLYGDGVFEGIRAYNGRIFRCRAHVDRLYESARAIALDIPMTRDEMAAKLREALEVNGLTDAYIRLVVTRGVGDLGLDPNKCARPSIIIIADSITLYPPELYSRGLDVVTVSTLRNHPNALSPRIKSLNYLNNILAKIEGLQAGVSEAIMLNQEGYVAECTGDNIFIVRQGALLTPGLHTGMLDGITRGVVIELARKAGIEVRETILTRFDLFVADECFLTGTAAEIIPVVRIDGRSIGDGKPGPITGRLLGMFRELTRNGGE